MTMLERNQYFLRKSEKSKDWSASVSSAMRSKRFNLLHKSASEKKCADVVSPGEFLKRKKKDAAKKARRSSLLDDCKNLLGGTSAKDITAEQKPKKSKVATVGKRRKTTSSLPPRSGKSKKTDQSSALSLLEQCKAAMAQVQPLASPKLEKKKKMQMQTLQ